MPVQPVTHEPASGYVTYSTGHQLDAEAVRFLELAAKAGLPPLGSGTVQEARAAREARKPAAPPAPVKRVENMECAGVPCRFYSSKEAGAEPEGLLMFYHGGGWALSSLDTHDSFCRLLANKGFAVLSVGYGLSPEHPFPQGLIDCIAATRWAHQNASQLNINPNNIAVGGDSAGGNFAAVIAQTPPCPIKLQVLIYPAVDCNVDAAKHPSLEKNKAGLMLETESMRWFMSHYFPTNSPQSMRSHPLASPLLAPDSMFANLPAALITTCGADPLYSEGRAYAELLESKGIPVEYHEWPGQLHGCATQQIGLSKAPEEIVEVIAGALNRAFA